MTDFPNGWAWSTIEEVGTLQLGRQRAPVHHDGPHMRPYLRVANVFEDRIDISDVKQMNFTPDEYERYELHDGDVLLNEGQSPELLGRPAIYRGIPKDTCFTNTLIRFKAAEGVDPRWALTVFRRHMHARRFMQESRITTNIAHLSIGRLRIVEFPVPPLAEQRRIVDTLDDHLSRLDAAAASLDAAVARTRAMTQALVSQLLGSLDCPSESLRELSTDVGYGTSTRCAYDGGGLAVARIPNLVDGRLEMSDAKFAVDTTVDLGSFRLTPGDLLIVRTNGSRDLIGRCAAVEEKYDAAFASYLIRFQLRSDRVLPAWVSAVLASGSLRRRIEAMAASSAGQYNLNTKNLGSLPIPVPSLDEQTVILREIGDSEESAARLNAALRIAKRRGAMLRRSLLDAAFSGRLVPQDPADEPAELLLKRIAAERETHTSSKPSRKRAVRRPSGA